MRHVPSRQGMDRRLTLRLVNTQGKCVHYQVVFISVQLHDFGAPPQGRLPHGATALVTAKIIRPPLRPMRRLDASRPHPRRYRWSPRSTTMSSVSTPFVRIPRCAHSRTDIRGISDRGTGDISARPRVTMASRAAATFGRKSSQSSPSISPVVPATFSRPLASWLIAPS